MPWELREAEEKLFASLQAIISATDNSDEAMLQRGSKKGALPERYFPQLYEDGCYREFLQGKFKGVDLLLPRIDDDLDQDEYPLEKVGDLLVDEVNDWSKALLHFLKTRFVDCKGAPRQGEKGGFQRIAAGGKEARNLVEQAGKCFDLRGLCADPCTLPERDAALTSIRATAIESGVASLPEAVVLLAELEELRLRLVKATKDGKHKHWFAEDGAVKSGTVIMKSSLNDVRRRARRARNQDELGALMWVFEHCVLKTRCEAVVEGMGSVINLHANGRRGLTAEKIEMEAYIDWNAPRLHEADDIIKEALDDHFKGKKWHFFQTSPAGQMGKFNAVSEVIQRLKALPSNKFPWMVGKAQVS